MNSCSSLIFLFITRNSALQYRTFETVNVCLSDNKASLFLAKSFPHRDNNNSEQIIKMKYSVFSLAITLLSLTSSNGFVVPASTTFVPGTSTSLFSGVTLEPEPEGGEELDAIVSMSNTRMKNMGQPEAGGESEDGQPIHTFWLTSEADGAFIKEIRTKVMKDAAKNANFPGFRKASLQK